MFKIYYLFFTALILNISTSLVITATYYMVLSNKDNKPGCLRDIINDANTDNNVPHNIRFDFSGDLKLLSPLPDLKKPIIIDGERKVIINVYNSSALGAQISYDEKVYNFRAGFKKIIIKYFTGIVPNIKAGPVFYYDICEY